MRVVKNLIALMVKIWPLLILDKTGNLVPTQINILSLAPSPTANQAQSEQESNKSSSSFYFNKSKKEKNKTKINYEEYHDELSQSINYFMTTQAQSDIWWKIICWVWWWQCKVMKVWNSEEGFPKKGFFFFKKDQI